MISYSLAMRGPAGPRLILTVDGVHDVGRVLATLARGNVEHASVAHDVGTDLRRSKAGTATLQYLEDAGGPVLGNEPNVYCEDCGHRQYVELDYVTTPFNCPVCPYGQLRPRNEDPDDVTPGGSP